MAEAAYAEVLETPGQVLNEGCTTTPGKRSKLPPNPVQP